MKNPVPAIMATLIATIAFFYTNAQVAQNSIAKLTLKVNTAQFDAAYNATSYINTAYKNTSNLSKASARAMKDFTKSFRSPANATWYDDGEGGFLAYFKDSAKTTRVDYNKKGNWVYTMAFYPENGLPDYVRDNVKSAISMYNINSVMEIHINNQFAYIIHTEGKKSYKTFKYTDEGGVEQIEELQKMP